MRCAKDSSYAVNFLYYIEVVHAGVCGEPFVCVRSLQRLLQTLVGLLEVDDMPNSIQVLRKSTQDGVR